MNRLLIHIHINPNTGVVHVHINPNTGVINVHINPNTGVIHVHINPNTGVIHVHINPNPNTGVVHVHNNPNTGVVMRELSSVMCLNYVISCVFTNKEPSVPVTTVSAICSETMRAMKTSCSGEAVASL